MAGARQLSDLASPRLIPQTPGPLAPARRRYPIDLKVIGAMPPTWRHRRSGLRSAICQPGRACSVPAARAAKARPLTWNDADPGREPREACETQPQTPRPYVAPTRGFHRSSSSSRPSFVLVDRGLPLRGVGHLQVAIQRYLFAAARSGFAKEHFGAPVASRHRPALHGNEAVRVSGSTDQMAQADRRIELRPTKGTSP
jgi:hypothetical protein